MSTNTNEYVDLLRKELSLVDEEDYNRRQAQKEEAKLKKIQRFIEKDLNAIELDWNDLYIIDELEIKDSLPDSFFDVFGNNRDIIIHNSLYSLRLSNPKLIDTFLRHLSQYDFKYEKRNKCDTVDGNKDFIIYKKQLSAKKYCEIMGQRHVHLDDSEADNILFGHILKFLHFDYKPPRYAMDTYSDSDSIHAYNINNMYNTGGLLYRSIVHWYTPSLVYLPDMFFYIRTLIKTGNNRTVAKFIAWDKYIRRYIQIYTAIQNEEYLHRTAYSKKTTFSEYLDWSWERLMENAIENFPFKREDITYEFGLPDDAPFTKQQLKIVDDFFQSLLQTQFQDTNFVK